MNPPVEAPTSSARRPATGTPSASSAFASLIPPRETYGGGATTSSSTSAATSWPGFSARRRPGPRCTSPASTAAAARERDGNNPRSASRESSRTRAIRGQILRGGEGPARVEHGGLDPLGDALGREADLGVQQLRRAVGDVAVGQPDAEDPRRRARPPTSTSQTPVPNPPASTPSSTVTSSSCSAASWASSPVSSGLAKRASATVTSSPPSASRSAAPERLPHAGAVADDRDALALAQDLAGADLRAATAPSGSGTPTASPRG